MTKPHSIVAMGRQASALAGQQGFAQNHSVVAAVTHHGLFISYFLSQGQGAFLEPGVQRLSVPQCSRLLARIAPIAVGRPYRKHEAAHTISLSGPLPLFNLIFLPLDVAEPVQRKG